MKCTNYSTVKLFLELLRTFFYRICIVQYFFACLPIHGNGLLFHMTQLINRSNTKNHRTLSKPAVTDH